MAALLKLRTRSPEGRGVYVFANPANLENGLVAPGGHLAHDRKRLTVKLSVDDCATWTHSRVLEEGPSGYSALAEAPDATILCLYECGMFERNDRFAYAGAGAVRSGMAHGCRVGIGPRRRER